MLTQSQRLKNRRENPLSMLQLFHQDKSKMWFLLKMKQKGMTINHQK